MAQPDPKKAFVAAFGRRLQTILVESGSHQTDLARHLGVRNDLISRLCRGQTSAIQLRLLAGIALWADTQGVSLRWLILGLGSMHPTTEASPGSGRAGVFNQIVAYSMLCALGKRFGYDIDDLAAQWAVAEDLPTGPGSPAGGILTHPIAESVRQLNKGKDKPT